MDNCIIVKDISKTFRLTKKQMQQRQCSSKSLIAVNNLSFEVHHGEIFGLLGANGAGKTTTLRMLAGMIKPDSGSIVLNPLSTLDKKIPYKNQIGFLTNDLKFDPYFSSDYLFDFFSNLYNIPLEIANQRKQQLFDKFGISSFSHLKLNELSTGMKQKVSLVLSLVHDPEIIIYDEPTNGLDIVSSKIVEDYLLELHSSGKTIILSTHIFSLVEKLCNRIMIIKDGSGICCGEVSQICSQQKLEDYFFVNYNRGL